jgi:hypothetical protein
MVPFDTGCFLCSEPLEVFESFFGLALFDGLTESSTVEVETGAVEGGVGASSGTTGAGVVTTAGTTSAGAAG